MKTIRLPNLSIGVVFDGRGRMSGLILGKRAKTVIHGKLSELTVDYV